LTVVRQLTFLDKVNLSEHKNVRMLTVREDKEQWISIQLNTNTLNPNS